MLFLAMQSICAQVALKPLIEEFSSPSFFSGYIANFTNDLYDANSASSSLIKYPLEDLYTTNESEIRASYYNVGSTPTIVTNGTEYYEHPGFGLDTTGVPTQSTYDSLNLLVTNLEIDIVEAMIIDQSVFSINFELTALDIYEEGLRLYVAIVEKETLVNSENVSKNVLMKLLPSVGGVGLPAFSIGQVESFSYTHDLNENNVEEFDDLKVIVFVQDDSDKSIIQSESSEITANIPDFNIEFKITDSNNAPIEGATVEINNTFTDVTDANGVLLFEDISANNYFYRIIANGYNDVEGDIPFLTDDVNIEISMEEVLYFFYEPFTFEPNDDWILVHEDDPFSSALFWDNQFVPESMSFTRWLSTSDIRLETPILDFSNFMGGTVSFKLGHGFTNQYISSDIIVEMGAIIIPSGGGPTSFTPLLTENVSQEDIYIDLETSLDFLAGTDNEVRLYWSFLSPGEQAWFNLDEIIIEEKMSSSSTIKKTEFANIVYPNPTENILYIESELILDEVLITDLSGQIIFKSNLKSNKYNLDIPTFKSGMYLLILKSDELIKTEKLFIK